MKNLVIALIALTAIILIGVAITIAPIAVYAASTSDNPSIGQTSSSSSSSSNNNNNSSSSTASTGNNGFNSNNNNEKLSTTGSTEAATNDTVANTLVLTAIPTKASVGIGDSETIHIKASMSNGTGISDATIRAMIVDYVTAKEKVLLGGKTDSKGTLDLTANIGSHAKPGQFLAVVNGTKGDLHKTISTGFVVTDGDRGSSSSGSSSSSSSSSGGKCSGSDCK